jgi:hypothetical protein
MFFAALPLALAAALPPTHEKPQCHTLTEAALKQDVTLSEPCYVVTQFLDVQGNVTVSPGTTLLFGQGASLVMQNGGTLKAIGTPDKPITFRGRDHTPGYWNGLQFVTNSSSNVLSYSVVEDGGAQGASNADVVVSVGGRLAMDHTTVRNSATDGLFVDQRGILAKFAENHFEGNARAMAIKASDIPGIDPATTYTGNRKNYVYIVSNDSSVTEEGTWHALPVPYHFGGTPDLHAAVRIEPGARLEFEESFGLDVNNGGSLTAEGTAAKPITFTGTDATPGFWDGIYINSNSAQNQLSHVVITYGGKTAGLAQADLCVSVNASASVTNSEIAESATAGLRAMQNAKLTQSDNQIHDNKQSVLIEQ